jgi:hypothetical protein
MLKAAANIEQRAPATATFTERICALDISLLRLESRQHFALSLRLGMASNFLSELNFAAKARAQHSTGYFFEAAFFAALG